MSSGFFRDSLSRQQLEAHQRPLATAWPPLFEADVVLHDSDVDDPLVGDCHVTHLLQPETADPRYQEQHGTHEEGAGPLPTEGIRL